MELKNLSDKKLAERIIDYIERTDKLKRDISNYLEEKKFSQIKINSIRDDYKKLKEELRADAKYLDLARNQSGSLVYKSAFKPSIREAAAFGFTVATNGAVNFSMFCAVSEAHYKLTKYYTLDKWKSV